MCVSFTFTTLGALEDYYGEENHEILDSRK